ncbi:nucleotidyltransferase family protein [uncultured Lentibacter sp.]|uniref:nucleotidyltransferase family protein n=1 Tax=uncultured Lentibacter sp. TaxID=1659309 RepID=UPI002628D27F|nr:nucleotidyltransferase family protein [uncultured Lentibacter sp.]
MRRAVLLPAAGASSRMRGRDKLLEDVGGQPCLRHLAQAALASADSVFVALPALAHPRAEALAGLALTLVPVPDAATGMSAALKAGAVAARAVQAEALMVLPADMPDLAPHLAPLWDAFEAFPEGQILRAFTDGGQAGHPVIFPAACLRAFATLTGDSGAAPVLRQFEAALVAHKLPDASPTRDLDTPQDWAQWRASGARPAPSAD